MVDKIIFANSVSDYPSIIAESIFLGLFKLFTFHTYEISYCIITAVGGHNERQTDRYLDRHTHIEINNIDTGREHSIHYVLSIFTSQTSTKKFRLRIHLYKRLLYCLFKCTTINSKIYTIFCFSFQINLESILTCP